MTWRRDMRAYGLQDGTSHAADSLQCSIVPHHYTPRRTAGSNGTHSPSHHAHGETARETKRHARPVRNANCGAWTSQCSRGLSGSAVVSASDMVPIRLSHLITGRKLLRW